jgi:putative transposase
MARKPRIHLPGAVYHVMLRGNGGQKIFFGEEDYARLYLLLQEGTTRFSFRIHAFCCMGNHIHLAIQVGGIPLSKIMQNISFRYTRWINRRKRRIGHLFQGRYKAVLVDQDSYLLELTRYIHLNPVRAGLVQKPIDHPWSGHRAYMGKEVLPWLSTEEVLSRFSKNRYVARQRYGSFVSEGMSEGHREEFHRGRAEAAEGGILGDDRFIERVLRKSQAAEDRKMPLQRLVMRVVGGYDLRSDQLNVLGRNRKAAEARAVVGYLSVQTQSATLTEVAGRFGRDVTTLSKGVQRIAKRAAESEAVSRRLWNLIS